MCRATCDTIFPQACSLRSLNGEQDGARSCISTADLSSALPADLQEALARQGGRQAECESYIYIVRPTERTPADGGRPRLLPRPRPLPRLALGAALCSRRLSSLPGSAGRWLVAKRCSSSALLGRPGLRFGPALTVLTFMMAAASHGRILAAANTCRDVMQGFCA